MSLESENPYGRLDVLAFKLSERLVTELESYWGLTGIWDMVKNHVEEGIQDVGLGKIPTPFLEALSKVANIRRKQGDSD